MNPRFLHACESFVPAEKACWEILLRDQPGAAPLPEPVLDTAMQRTLDQLWTVLREPSIERRLEAARGCPSPLPVGSACALIAHLPYFNAGLRALELIAKELERADPEFTEISNGNAREDLSAAFSLLVQWQLHALCSVCEHADRCWYSGRAPAILRGFAVKPPSAPVKASVGGRRRSRQRKPRTEG